MLKGAWCALRRFLIEGYLIEWIMFIARVLLFGYNIHCSVLLFFLGMAVSRPKCSNKLSSVLGGWQ